MRTFATDAATTDAIVEMMMMSREAVVDYMMPLGLHHLFDTGHHHGPGPWVSELARPEWNPTYYHQADKEGIGFDRTATGSNAIAQYAPPLAKLWADPAHYAGRTCCSGSITCAGTIASTSGKTLWEELVAHYDYGVAAARRFAQALGCAEGTCRCAPPRGNGDAASRAGARGALVARRLHRVFPVGERLADACRNDAARAIARRIQVDRVFPYAPGRG